MNELYIVIELQKTGNQMASLVTSHETLQDAQHKFYSVAASAAISQLDKHSVILINDDGFTIEKLTFEH